MTIPPVTEPQEHNSAAAQLTLALEKKTEPPTPEPPKNLGAHLKQAREKFGFSLDDIAAEIKIRAHHLRVLEEGRYGELPSRTHAVGFVKSYASILDLDSDAMVALCRRELGAHGPQQLTPTLTMLQPAAESMLPSNRVMAASLLAAVLLYSITSFIFGDHDKAAPFPAPAITTESVPPPAVVAEQPAPPTAAAPAMTAPPPAATTQDNTGEKINPPAEDEVRLDVAAGVLQQGHNNTLDAPAPPEQDLAKRVEEKSPPAGAAPSRIKLKAIRETTVKIFDGKGKLLAERVIKGGEAFYVPDHAGYTLATSNAAALSLQIDGRDMPPLGEADEAMHNIPLNPDELLEYLR